MWFVWNANFLTTEVTLHGEGLVFFYNFYRRKVLLEFCKVGVPLVAFMNMAHQPFVDTIAQDFVNFRSAYHKNLADHSIYFSRTVNQLYPFTAPVPVARHHEVRPLRQWSAYGFEGFPAHEDGMAEGGFFEEFQILGEVPGEGSVRADEAVGIHGYYGG